MPASTERDDAPAAVWRTLSPAEMQQQFDMRVAVPDAGDFIPRYTARSIDARKRLTGTRDLRYGPGPMQTLDIFPAAATNAPVVMFWHGGGWRAQSKNEFSFVAEPLVAAGITAVIVGYDLFPAVTLQQMIAQACEAIAWVAKNIAAHGSDPSRIVVSGHSAGAHLAAMALAHDFRREGLTRSFVRGALLTSGSFDMEPHSRHERYLDMGLGDAQLTRDVSPACNPPLDPDIRIVAGVGGNETPGYIWQSEFYAHKCRQRGHDARALITEGDHHFSIVERLADPAHPLTRALIDLAQRA